MQPDNPIQGKTAQKRPYAAQYVVDLLIRVYAGYAATYPNNPVNKQIKIEVWVCGFN